jgi:hypothetical protein
MKQKTEGGGRKGEEREKETGFGGDVRLLSGRLFACTVFSHWRSLLGALARWLVRCRPVVLASFLVSAGICLAGFASGKKY